MMDGDEQVVERGVSQYGLHRLHVIKAGGPVDVEKWVKEMVLAAKGTVEAFYQYKDEVGMHHLRLYWRCE